MSQPGKIVVTGAGSFIGHHLALYFKKTGYDVVGTLYRDETDIAVERIALLEKAGVQLEPLDITNNQELESFVRLIAPDYWVHHGGWATAYGSLQYDLERAHAVNTLPLTTLYKVFSEIKGKGIVITGSNAEYSDTENAVHEDDACWPSAPYGLSKLTETLRSLQLAEEFKVTTRVARVFIPYGTLDAPGKLLPQVVESLRHGRSIELSPCLQKRDFLCIDDLTRCYGALVDDFNRKVLVDVFNVCSGQAISLKQLLVGIAREMGADPGLLQFGAISMRPGEQPVTFGSNAKAQSILNWKPQSLEAGLEAYLKHECFPA